MKKKEERKYWIKREGKNQRLGNKNERKILKKVEGSDRGSIMKEGK